MQTAVIQNERRGTRSNINRQKIAKEYLAKQRLKGKFLLLRNFVKALDFPYKKEEWQINDLETIIRITLLPIKEVLLIRARNGSKTEDTVIIGLYFAYLGYDVLYFAAEGSQITKPQKYMNQIINRSFLVYCLKPVEKRKMRSIEFQGGGSMEIRNLTEKKARSPRADITIFDEEAQSEIDAYNASAGIMKSSKLGLKIHCSTPIKGSIFEENYDRLLKREKKYKETLVLMRKCWDIEFLMENREVYEEEKKYYDSIGMGWYFRQENECSFENPQGAIFRSVLYDGDKIKEYIKNNNLVFTEEKYSGLDWNPVAGHWLVGGKWSEDNTAFLVTHVIKLDVGYSHEINRDTYERMRPYFTLGNKLMVEEGGINEAFTNWLKRELNDGTIPTKKIGFEDWDSAGKNKNKCVMNLISKMLLIDSSVFEGLAKEVSEAHWDENVKGDEPKMYKSSANSPHRLDALLHATSPELQRGYGIGSYRWRERRFR